jgi:hypothetical protein
MPIRPRSALAFSALVLLSASCINSGHTEIPDGAPATDGLFEQAGPGTGGTGTGGVGTSGTPAIGGTGGTGTGGAGTGGAPGADGVPAYPCVERDYILAGGPSSPPATYHLAPVRNVAAPAGGGAGITFDGHALWLLSVTGEPEARVHTLIEVDAATLATGRRLALSGVLDDRGQAASGITWDGSGLWLSVAGVGGKLLRIDATTGAVVRTFSSPADVAPTDLDFDGHNLWLSAGDNEVFLIDPATGGILRHFRSAFCGRRNSGIAIRPGELWIDGLQGGLALHDPASGKLLGNVADPGDDRPREGASGFRATCFVSGQFVVLDRLGITFSQILEGP